MASLREGVVSKIDIKKAEKKEGKP